jgi:hypothetical protein
MPSAVAEALAQQARAAHFIAVVTDARRVRAAEAAEAAARFAAQTEEAAVEAEKSLALPSPWTLPPDVLPTMARRVQAAQAIAALALAPKSRALRPQQKKRPSTSRPSRPTSEDEQDEQAEQAEQQDEQAEQQDEQAEQVAVFSSPEDACLELCEICGDWTCNEEQGHANDTLHACQRCQRHAGYDPGTRLAEQGDHQVDEQGDQAMDEQQQVDEQGDQAMDEHHEQGEQLADEQGDQADEQGDQAMDEYDQSPYYE